MGANPRSAPGRLSGSGGLAPWPDPALGRPPADVDHQPLVRAHGTGVHDTGVDQPRFFQPGDDFDGVTESGAGAFQEPALAARAPQGVGAYLSHADGVLFSYPLPQAI